MTLNETHIRELLDASTPGPWEWWGNELDGPMDSVLDIQVECGEYCAGGMAKLDATPNLEYDQKLIALAPELAAEVIRLREALEKQLNGINLMIALADMIQPQTEAQQTAITLGRDLCDDLTRILNGDHNA